MVFGTEKIEERLADVSAGHGKAPQTAACTHRVKNRVRPGPTRWGGASLKCTAVSKCIAEFGSVAEAVDFSIVPRGVTDIGMESSGKIQLVLKANSRRHFFDS